MSDTLTIAPKEDKSQTSKLGVLKFALAGICSLASIYFFVTGNPTGGSAMAAIAANAGVSGMLGMKAQDAKK